MLRTTRITNRLILNVRKKHSNIVHRRIYIPFEKKHIIDFDKFSVLRIKRSVTNYFISFTFNGTVLFSSSAGSAGLPKKQRRTSYAAIAMSNKFCKYIRYYYKSNSDFSPFRNIIVALAAPISFFKSFMKSFRSFHSTLHDSMISDVSSARLASYTRLRKSFSVLRKMRESLLSAMHSRDTNYAKCSSGKLLHLILRSYNCEYTELLKHFYRPIYGEHKRISDSIDYASLHRIFDRQSKLRFGTISSLPKKLVIRSMMRLTDLSHHPAASIRFASPRIDDSITTADLRDKPAIIGTRHVTNRLDITRSKINMLLYRSHPRNLYTMYERCVSLYDMSCMLRSHYIYRGFVPFVNMIKRIPHRVYSSRMIKHYIAVFDARLYVCFVSTHSSDTSILSKHIWLFNKFMLNALYSDNISGAVDTMSSQRRSRLPCDNIIRISHDWLLSNHNLWMFSIQSTLASNLYAYCEPSHVSVESLLQRKLYMLPIDEPNSPCHGYSTKHSIVDSLRDRLYARDKIASDGIYRHFLIPMEQLRTLPHHCLSSILYTDTREDVSLLVVKFIYDNILILPVREDVSHSYFNMSNVDMDTTVRKKIDRSYYTQSHVRFYVVKRAYTYSISKIGTFANVPMVTDNLDDQYSIYVKQQIQSSCIYIYDCVMSILRNVSRLITRIASIIFGTIFKYVDWRAYFPYANMSYRAQHYVINASRRLRIHHNAFVNACLEHNNDAYGNTTNILSFNIFLMRDISSFPYNGCRSRYKFK